MSMRVLEREKMGYKTIILSRFEDLSPDQQFDSRINAIFSHMLDIGA